MALAQFIGRLNQLDRRPEERPALSVVICVYNRADAVKRSVESALEQDYAGTYEVVIVDDGSTDSTPSVLSAFGPRVRIIRQPNLGRSAARNAGVRHSSADLIAFLDSDDYWLPGKIRADIEAFTAQPNAGLVYSNYFEVDSSDDRCLGIVSLPDELPVQQMFETLEWVGVPSMVTVRRAVFEQVGGFDERLRWAEDIDIYLRLRQICSFYRISWSPQVVYRKRTRAEDSVNAYSLQDRAILEKVLREHFGRRANRLIKMRNQRAAGLLTIALVQLKQRDWRRAIKSFSELVSYRPTYAPRFAIQRLCNRLTIATSKQIA